MAAQQAVSILKDCKSPSDMPIEYLSAEDCVLTINKTVAEELGITIPEDLADAEMVETAS